MLILLARVARSPKRPSAFDWAGQVVALIALVSLMYGLITGGSHGFGTPVVIVALIIATVGIATFLRIQAVGRHPMMPLNLFRSTGMRIALFAGFAFMIGNFGSVFVMSLYLQQHLGLSPLLAGLLFLPSAAFSITGNIVSGGLTNRFGARMPASLGLGLMAVGLVAQLLTAPTGSPILAGTFLIFTGLGGSIAMPPVTSVVLASVQVERAGTASAVFNTFRQVGGAVAIALFGGLLATSTTFVPGLQVSFIVAAALLAAATVASTHLPRTLQDT
jgi:DHA2 family methylenomycin A resistance protein-like MFS transporter